MIGVGVFSSLGFQLNNLDTGFSILMVWLAGGLVAFCGAVCYAELVAMFPRSGGEYHLLSSAYHPAPGFLAGWVSATAGFPAPTALAASAFGAYIAEGFPELGVTPSLLAVLLVLSVTAVHVVNVRLSSGFQIASTVCKVVLILALIIAGFSATGVQDVRFLPTGLEDLKVLGTGSFGVALLWVLYSYEGWNGGAYIAGEVENPQRNVPLALLTGTALVTLLYVGINAAFLYAAPADLMRGKPEVGLVAAVQIFGEEGGRIMGTLIAIGLVSAVSAMTWAGPRVSARMGEDYSSLRFLSRKTAGGAPVVATVVQSLVAILMILAASFEQILVFVEVLLLVSSMATVSAVVVLRILQPNRERPYRAFAYPLTPVIFFLVTLFAVFFSVLRHPWESLAGLVVLLAGAGLYWLCRVYHKNENGASGTEPNAP